jgi:PAS domain S-box-containing protein
MKMKGVTMVSEGTVEPWFTSEQSAGLRDFWQVYTAHYDQLVKVSLDATLADPVFGPMIRSIPPEVLKVEEAQGLERLRLAIFEGNWAPYEIKLRADGALYAKMGIAYEALSQLTKAYLRELYSLMVKTFCPEPERLAEAIVVTQSFIDKAMNIIVAQYLKTKEDSIKEGEEDLATTLDSIGDAVLATDTAGCIKRINPVAEKLTGWKLEECKGKPLVEIFHIVNEETGETAENPVERVLKERTTIGLANHTVLISRDGTRYPIADSAAPIRGIDGQIRGVVLVFRDVTEEHRAEQALRKSERTLTATLDSIHEGVSIVENGGTILFANRMAHKITGLLLQNQSREQWGAISNVFYADAKTPCPPQERPVGRALRGEVVRDLDLYYLAPSVPEGGVYLNINANPILDKDGTQLGAVCTYRDVSYRKRLEEARAESRRVQEASRLKSEFLANMSHELRTPLNSIIGFSELLHDEEVGHLSPKQKEFLGDILTSGRHLLQLINDVLDLSKVEAGKIEFQPEKLELPKVINEVNSVLRTVAASKNIKIEVSVEPELKEIVLDPGRLKQVLYNYLSNALKFTPNNGKIRVCVMSEGRDTFRLEVEDNGIGISEKDLGKLFTEFQQLDAGTAKKHAGTGLGLALTKRLVEAQGGNVGVKSSLHQGSTFYAILPRCAELTNPLPKPLIIEPDNPDASRVLVVEDDPGDRSRIVQLLVGAGYAVETASTGLQAISMSRQKHYDAVTLDLLLPDMNGLEVLRSIQGNSQVPPVVIITVVTENATAGFAVHDTLSKPLDGSNLLISLQRAGVTPEKTNKILLVDDDPRSLKLISATLEQLGYQTSCFQTAEEALVASTKEKAAAIVLDLVMPEIDGFQFLARFRQLQNNAAIPVLIWTNKELTRDEHLGLYSSAQAVIQKGAGTSELVAALRGYLNEAKRTK